MLTREGSSLVIKHPINNTCITELLIMNKIEKLSIYKRIIKSLISYERTNKCLQIKNRINRELATLQYQKTKTQDISGIKSINERILELKNSLQNVDNDKSLFFVNDSIMLRSILNDIYSKNIDGKKEEINKVQNNINDIIIFLQNQKKYEELMNLYNLSKKYSQDEKIIMTANRVGLQVPK